MANVVLTPIQELTPGRVSEVRNQAIAQVVALAAKELSLSPGQLLVRDIRPFSDLGFGANAAADRYMATAVPIDVWGTFMHALNTYVLTRAAPGVYCPAITSGTTMTDQRYVCIYGVRDMRTSPTGAAGGLPTIINQEISLIKFDIGTSDRAIWDLSKCESYKNAIVGISSQPLVIPPLTPYQISCLLIAGGVAPYLQLLGFVVEPVGLLITPTGAGAAQVETQLIPVAELAPGAVTAIRESIIRQLISLAATELKKSPEDLVVRDIRPFTDIAWATHANIGTAVLTTDLWHFISDDSANFGKFTEMIAAGSDVMADDRYVAIYGVKDLRMAQEAPVAQALSQLKLHVGGNDRVIWDLQNMQAYPSHLAAVCPSAIIIPPRTSYQIYGYGCLSDGTQVNTDIDNWLMLEGVVVESRGLVISP